MNWRVSSLDGFTLVSNSDAHSPLNLGREANLFNTELSYPAIKSALENGNPDQFLGTFEFYPEEGKYHLDGHRACNQRLTPEQTLAAEGLDAAVARLSEALADTTEPYAINGRELVIELPARLVLRHQRVEALELVKAMNADG